MHLRRALLLFAIVLGMAALVASLSRPVDDRRRQSTTPTQPEPGPPTATPGTGPSDASDGAAALPTDGAGALFCVERDPEACHRALVAARLAERLGVEVTHLTP